MTDHTSRNAPDVLPGTPDGRPEEAQPRWRRDFPVDWGAADFVARREFVKFVVLTSAAFAAGQTWLALKGLLGRGGPQLEPAAVATLDELEVGGAKTFTYPQGSTPRLLVRTGPQTFVAYDQQCTHLQCPIVPAVKDGKLHCPCHNGWFDLNSGEPLAGPPRRRLPRVQVEVRADTVFATGVEDGSS